MSKITAKLHELRDASVAYVSLVDRAATRIPFRIMKRDEQEKPMINLAQLGKALTGTAKKAEKPAITGVVVLAQKTEARTEAVKAALAAHGFSVDTVTKNDDGTLLYAQCDNPLAEDSHLVRVSDQMLVVLKGFDPYSEALSDNADFNELVAANGFFAGMNTAFSGLSATISDALQNADSPEAAAPAIKGTLDKFSTYVQALVEGLPSAAFKADMTLQTLAMAARKADAANPTAPAPASNAPGVGQNYDLTNIPKTAPSGISENDWNLLSDEAKLKWLADSTNTPASGATLKTDSNTILQITELLSAAPEGSDGTEWVSMSLGDKLAWLTASYTKANGAGGQDNDDGAGGPDSDANPVIAVAPAVTAKADAGVQAAPAAPAATDDALATLVQAVTVLSAGMQNLTKKMEEQGKSFSTKIDEITRKTDDVSSKIKGTVISAPPRGDLPSGKEAVSKAEVQDQRTGCFDTAFIKRGR